MEANELMICDWVLDGKKPAQITGILCDDLFETTLSPSVGGECISPIPLTAEILEKNGFSHIMYSDAYYSITIGDTYVELRKYENMAIWFNWEENNNGVYADYILPMPEFVHELQHLLRLCNIEKEIEL